MPGTSSHSALFRWRWSRGVGVFTASLISPPLEGGNSRKTWQSEWPDEATVRLRVLSWARFQFPMGTVEPGHGQFTVGGIEAPTLAGLFIVFEGGEGSGKSTQAERLYQRLSQERQPSLLVREPGTTPLGLYLRDYLKSKQPLTPQSELLLFEAARAQLVAGQIRPSLEQGINVIADRFAASTIAYQGYGRMIGRDVIDYLNDYATGGLKPDVTLLLDINPEEGLHRVGKPQLQLALEPESATGAGRADVEGHRRFEDQPLAFHNRVRRGYLELAGYCPGWQVFEARLSEDELAEQIWKAVSPLLPSNTLDPASASTPALL